MRKRIKRVLSVVSSAAITLSAFSGWSVSADNLTDAGEALKPLKLWYDEPADKTGNLINDAGSVADRAGWEKQSLPLGNGYMGASLFGRLDDDRIQLTDKTLANSYYSDGGNSRGGLMSFADIYIGFNQDFSKAQNYRRELDLREGVASVSYTYDGVQYEREYLTSYPDNVLAVKLTASEPGKLTFNLHPEIPFVGTWTTNDNKTITRTGEVTADVPNNRITMSGN